MEDLMRNEQPLLKPHRNVVINLRANQNQRELIDRAARILGKNRSDFLLETACREAETVLLDQRFFALEEPVYTAFLEALESSSTKNEKLQSLFEAKAPWDPA
jgi:uncharacterized protein (DUF1778 family)